MGTKPLDGKDSEAERASFAQRLDAHASLFRAVRARSITEEERSEMDLDLRATRVARDPSSIPDLAEEVWKGALAEGEVIEADHDEWVRETVDHWLSLHTRHTGAFERLLKIFGELKRRDPCYAVDGVLGAAIRETHDSSLTRWHQGAARECLEAMSDELAVRALDDTASADRFARLVQQHTAKAWRIVTGAWSRLEEEARAQQPPDVLDESYSPAYPYDRLFYEATRTVETRFGPVLWADAEFAELLRTLGRNGEKTAEHVLGKSAARLVKFNEPFVDSEPFPWNGTQEERSQWWTRRPKAPSCELGGAAWGLWFHGDSHPRIYDYLARALWADMLRPQLVHEARNPPSLVIEVHEDVTRVHSQVVRLEESNGQRALVFDGTDRFILVPSLAEEMAQALVERGVGKLGTVTAHRALRWQLTTAHDRALRGEPDARVLIIDGGWSVYAYEKLGLKSKAEAENLKAITYAQDAVHVSLPDGSRERMLNLREWPAQGRRPGRIQQTLGTMLLPHYVFELGLTGRRLREAQRLIPVCALPPFVGRNRDHGPQATLSMLVVRELRTKARELAKDGAVRITRERWVEMARESALPPTLLGRVIDRWIQDGPDAPAFLSRVSPDAYTLAPVHSRELAFILASGRTENRAVEAGKQSVRARQGKMRRLGRGKP